MSYSRLNYVEQTCYSGIGRYYRGSISKSMTGHKCKPWKFTAYTNVNFHEEDLVLNYCRNPDGHLLKPWCFTNESENNRQICNIPKCKLRDNPQAVYPFGGILNCR